MGFPLPVSCLRLSQRALLGLSLATAALVALPTTAVLADNAFVAPAEFNGRINVSAAERGQPIFPGSTVNVKISGLEPGQSLMLQRGATQLFDAPVKADDKGELSASFTLPADAATGMHQLVALLDGPSVTQLVKLKVSSDPGLVGEAGFDVTTVKPASGLYQSVYSPRANALFVSAADFRPLSSALIKLDPETLTEIARITPPADPAAKVKEGEAPGPVGVLGLGIDDTKGTIWATNTFDNTVAVYGQDDLGLIKQFPADYVYHSRDVKVDGARGRAYVSSAATDTVHVFDTESLERIDQIRIKSGKRGGDFSLLGLGIDPTGKWLFAVSRESDELAVIDLETAKLDRVLALPGAKNASGVDYDPTSGKVFIASQDSDNLLILDLESGKVEHSVTVGAGPLNVAFDPVQKLAFVSSRGSGTVAAVSLDGKLVANLPGGSFANHVAVDGKGAVFAVNKSFGPDDAEGDKVARITAK